MGPAIAPRVVLDTNVLISCLLFRGRVSFLRDWWMARRIVPLMSRATFAEFHHVLAFPKFSLLSQEIATIINTEILPWFEVVEMGVHPIGRCRDPHDEKFLDLVARGEAEYLITGDQDLLVLGFHGPCRIVTPMVFQTALGGD